MNIFMQANKNQLRFKTTKGILNVESLFQLPLTELNTLVMELKELANKSKDQGYLTTISNTAEEYNTLRFQVAEAVILYRLEELETKNKLIKNKVEREKLLSIVAELELEEFKKGSIEELKSRIADLS